MSVNWDTELAPTENTLVAVYGQTYGILRSSNEVEHLAVVPCVRQAYTQEANELLVACCMPGEIPSQYRLRGVLDSLDCFVSLDMVAALAKGCARFVEHAAVVAHIREHVAERAAQEKR